MKKLLLSVLALTAGLASNAQVTIGEPEFVGCYYVLTSDSTYAELPKENGTVKKHENKVNRWAKIASGVGGLAGAAGVVGMAASGSVNGLVSSARVVTTAAGVESAAASVSTLAGISGMDIVFQGKASTYVAKPEGDSLRFLIREENNETNPLDLYRIVRFKTTKKERRVQWYEYSSSVLGSSEAEENGYINLSGTKYGDTSYLITVPASSLKEGQYGIFYMNVESALAIPVATFGIE